MLDVFKEVNDLLAVGGSIIVSFSLLTIKSFKLNNLKRIAENYIKVEKQIKENIENAEKIINYCGSYKKEWVKTKVKLFCVNNRLVYDEDVVNNLIEKYIDFTKIVNKREKDV